MMNLDEAIQHCEEVAYQKDLESGFETDNERYAMTDKERADCKECASEHRQLAEWLKELKAYRNKSEIPTSCGDAISRQAVEKITWEEPTFTDALNVLAEVRDKVRALPSVTPQQRSGRWILIHRNGVNMYVCSECDNEPLLIGENYPIFKLSDYCPYCGAKMEVV